MARAFGDFCLKDYGLISVPDVSYHRLTEKDAFVILATDGVIVYASTEELNLIASV
jgi:serine/threonine protein phosphatase PrpC